MTVVPRGLGVTSEGLERRRKMQDKQNEELMWMENRKA